MRRALAQLSLTLLLLQVTALVLVRTGLHRRLKDSLGRPRDNTAINSPLTQQQDSDRAGHVSQGGARRAQSTQVGLQRLEDHSGFRFAETAPLSEGSKAPYWLQVEGHKALQHSSEDPSNLTLAVGIGELSGPLQGSFQGPRGREATLLETDEAGTPLAHTLPAVPQPRGSPWGLWAALKWLAVGIPQSMDGLADWGQSRQLARWERWEQRRREGDAKEARMAAKREETEGGPSEAEEAWQWHRDALKADESPDECAAFLRVPKVALLFLTRGVLFHEASWELWFAAAAGKLPLTAVKETGCSGGLLAHLQRVCAPYGAHDPLRASVVHRQHLFTVYMHVGSNEKSFHGLPEGSLFHGLDIAERVEVEWGTFSLVEATRALLRAALQEPLNAKFVLLSESGIPLYSPQLLYTQLFAERKSRLNSCITPGWERNKHRWSGKMESDVLKRQHWRKSFQWVGLSRPHAELAVNDTHIAGQFSTHCKPTWEDGWWRDCYSDEHYFPTLVAAAGRENETDCHGSIMHVDWSRLGEHPRAYEPREVTSARLRSLRQPTKGCAYPGAVASAQQQFVSVNKLSSSTCQITQVPYGPVLGPQCPLLARKFPVGTAALVAELFAGDCSTGLHITSDPC